MLNILKILTVYTTYNRLFFLRNCTILKHNICVPDPGKGVCADPVNGGAILGKGGPDPQGGNKERQLSPDKGKDKT